MPAPTNDLAKARETVLQLLDQKEITYFNAIRDNEYENYDFDKIILILSIQKKDKSCMEKILEELNYDKTPITLNEKSSLLFFQKEETIGFINFPDLSNIHETMGEKRDTRFSQALEKIIHNINSRDLVSLINELMLADTLHRCETMGISKKQYNLMEYLVQFQNYKSNYYKMAESGTVLEQNSEYDHIKHFSRLYFTTLEVIKKEIGFSESLTIHDAGTSSGFFTFLMSVLDNEKTIQIKEVLASDISTLIFHSIKIIDKYHNDNNMVRKARVMLTDFTNDCFYIPETDITANLHVLEHLPNEITAKNVLKRLWEKTSKLLIINVPFEAEPDKIWGHNISFDPDKLKEWANELKGGTLISEELRHDGKNLLEEGFLIIKRH